MASTYLQRTTGTPTLGTKCTVSFWWKNSEGKPSGGSDRVIFGTETTADCYIYLRNTGELGLYQASTGGFDFRTSRLITDCSAWYHICFTFDSTLSTSADRIKIYINGVRETAFNASTTMAQNATIRLNEASKVINIGGGFNQNMNGLLSHINFIDGTAYDASAFGSTDATTGEWQINTSPSVTYGNNGFFILKDGNSVTDQSGNSNNFTVGAGTLTKTESSPSNVFATANPNDVMKGSAGILKPTFSNGNLTLSSSAGNNYQTFGTIAVDTGKYYWETKATDCDGHRVGVFFGNNKVHGGSYYYGANAFYIHQNGLIYYNGSTYTYMSSLSDGDIVGVALDRTNGHIYLHKNGQYADGNGNNNQTFANAVSISTKLGVTMPSDITYPFFDVYGTAIMDINFGNGKFGTTAITTNSGNGYAGAEGSSIFNYQPPTGYSALSTKGLNT